MLNNFKMNFNHLLKKNSVVSSTQPGKIVIEWLETTAAFYINYTKLITCLGENEQSDNPASDGGGYIGQCPVVQAVILTRAMAIELKILLLDMERLNTDDQLNIDKEYRKLSKHTRVLKKLNQQATTAILLTTLNRKHYSYNITSRLN